MIDAAAKLFLERGFAATTVRDIADEAGVSVGTIMAVGEKSALLVAVFDSLIAHEHAGRTATARGTGVDQLLHLVQPFVTLFTTNGALARTYASTLVAGTHASTLFTDLASQLVDELTAVITAHQRMTALDARATAEALYAAYVGTLFTFSARGSDDAGSIMSELRTVFTAICHEE